MLNALNKTHRATFYTCSVILLFACSKKEINAPAETTLPAKVQAPPSIDAEKASQQLWLALENDIALAKTEVTALDDTIKQLLATPNPERLASAQTQWEKTETQIQQLNFLFRLAQSAPQVLSQIYELEYRIAAQPIQPGYLDSWGEYPYSGLVHDIGTPMTAQTLLQQHGLTDTEEVLLGLFAIEYLLFGENNQRASADFENASVLTDENTNDGLQHIEEIPSNRRRDLLQLQSSQLVSDFEMLDTLTRRDSETRVQIGWRALGLNDQWSHTKEAFNRAIARNLIDVVELQINAQKNENTVTSSKEEQGTPEISEQDSEASELPIIDHTNGMLQQKAKSIAIRLKSTRAALGYFNAKNRKHIEENLSEVSKILTKLGGAQPIDANAEEEAITAHNALVKSCYEKLKSISAQ